MKLPLVVAVVIILGGVLIVGPLVGLSMFEQTFQWIQELTDNAMAQGEFFWGIKDSSGDQPSGSILSGGASYDSGAVTIYGAGRLTVTGAQTASSSVNYNIRVVSVGSSSPITSGMSFTGTSPVTNKGGGTFESGLIEFQKDYLTYSELGIPNVGNAQSLELYVSLSITVDGTIYNIYSASTTNGGKPSIVVEHSSDADVDFYWSNAPSLDWS